jgi:radical SAM protein with 4Fe4S-binding SPASM domain
MSLDTFRKIIDTMGDDIFFLLLYHQGEPYINKNFLDFVRLAKEKKIYCTTSTNAHYFTDKNIRDTIDSGLDSMIVSIDGVRQESYETYRIKGNLNKVLQGLERFVRIKKELNRSTPLLALQFLVMKHNEHEIPEVKKLARKIGVDRLLIKNIEVRSKEEAQQWLPKDNRYRRYHFDDDKFEVKNNRKQSCPRPWLSTLINWDGSVVPCCFDKNSTYAMGNINQFQDFDYIWNNTRFKHFRHQLSTNRKSIDMCRNCNMGFGSFIPEFKWFKKKPDTPPQASEEEEKFPILQ